VAERAWIRGAQRGSVADFERLFRAHWPRAYRAALLVTRDAAAAEDIAQEAFLAAVRNLDRFDRRRPFGPWLHRIVVNRAIDWTRARKLRAEVELGDTVAAPASERDGFPDLGTLSPEHRAVIVLRYVLEYTPGEIADLLALPAPGRLLVEAPEPGSTWIVDADGARRHIGAWSYAAWSPHGRYVVVANGGELAAIDPTGRVRWTLARNRVAWPAWEGTAVDTRIAYLAASGLRVVAGDGTGDRLLDAYAAAEPPAWDPARLHTLAYETGGDVVLRAVDSGRTLWRTSVPAYGALAWSSDGRRLAVVAPSGITVLDGGGHVVRTIGSLNGQLLGAAFRPGTHELAVHVRYERVGSRRSEVKLVDVDHPGHARLLFAGPGVFGSLAWSPNGRWLLVTWPDADQFLFVHGHRIRAFSGIARQFGGGAFPRIGGWCCTSS
jgi:RNA polymerase sigma-70 factor, ECF subfamily